MNEFEILSVILSKKIDELQEIINQEIEKEKQKNIITKSIENCNQPIDLINIDFNVLSSFDDVTKNDIKTTLIKAKFLLEECKGLDITKQPQYKQTMEKLDDIYDLFVLIKDSKSNNIDELKSKLNSLKKFKMSLGKEGFIEVFDDFDLLGECLEESALSDKGKYAILINLLKVSLNIAKNFENKEESQNIVEEPTKEELKIEDYEEETLEDDSLDIYQEKIFDNLSQAELEIILSVKEIVENNILKIRELETQCLAGTQLFGFYNIYEKMEKGETNEYIPKQYIEAVTLLKMHKYMQEINEEIDRIKHNYQTIGEGNLNNATEYIKYCLTELEKPLQDYNEYLNSFTSNNIKKDNYKDLVFLNNTIKEFNSKELRESFNRYQIISALGELRNGDFRNISTFAFNGINVYSKKKGGPGGIGGIRVIYLPLGNDIILILNIVSRQNGYLKVKNIYENNKEMIKNIIEQSKDIKNKQKILDLNKDFSEEIYDFIDEREKSRKGGRTHD